MNFYKILFSILLVSFGLYFLLRGEGRGLPEAQDKRVTQEHVKKMLTRAQVGKSNTQPLDRGHIVSSSVPEKKIAEPAAEKINVIQGKILDIKGELKGLRFSGSMKSSHLTPAEKKRVVALLVEQEKMKTKLFKLKYEKMKRELYGEGK